MLPRQIQQTIGSLALVSGLAGLILTFMAHGVPAVAGEIGPWLVRVLIWGVALFVASGLLPFVWFAATGFQPRAARGGLMLWWLMLVVLVNRRWNGTLDRRAKGTPLWWCLGGLSR